MLKMRNWDGLTILYRDSATDQSDMAQMDWMKSGWFWRTFAEVIRREPINLIVDVGAHMGSFSLPAIVEARRHLPAARLVAFEPEEESHNLLVANVHLNHLSHLVEILNLGVGATDGAWFAAHLCLCFLTTGTPPDSKPRSSQIQRRPVQWSMRAESAEHTEIN